MAHLKIWKVHFFLKGILEVFELRLDVVCPLYISMNSTTLRVADAWLPRSTWEVFEDLSSEGHRSGHFSIQFFAKELQEDLENAEAVNQMGLFIEYVKLAAQLGTMGNGWWAGSH